jgi:hypothetical protein
MNSDAEMIAQYGVDNHICNVQLLIFKPKSVIAEKWYKYCETYITSGAYIDWATLGGVALGNIIAEGNYFGSKCLEAADSLFFSLGYENKSYEQYYSQDPVFIEKQINKIKEHQAKIITLYGTFMYQLPIPNGCLLDEMFKLKA